MGHRASSYDTALLGMGALSPDAAPVDWSHAANACAMWPDFDSFYVRVSTITAI